jgi:hypothetical protein
MKRVFRYGFVLLMLLLGPLSPAAQDTSVMAGGGVDIVQDPRIELLVQKHIKINESISTVEGFRIQVFSESGANSKSKAQAAYDELQARYPDMGIYLTFKTPNYKVRIGDFRTRLDAQRFLVELTADYPNAFIISEQIKLPQPE